MIKDIEEESKTKFSMKAEFSFSFKENRKSRREALQTVHNCDRIGMFLIRR